MIATAWKQIEPTMQTGDGPPRPGARVSNIPSSCDLRDPELIRTRTGSS
jgi:hypothetical protein